MNTIKLKKSKHVKEEKKKAILTDELQMKFQKDFEQASNSIRNILKEVNLDAKFSDILKLVKGVSDTDEQNLYSDSSEESVSIYNQSKTNEIKSHKNDDPVADIRKHSSNAKGSKKKEEKMNGINIYAEVTEFENDKQYDACLSKRKQGKRKDGINSFDNSDLINSEQSFDMNLHNKKKKKRKESDSSSVNLIELDASESINKEKRNDAITNVSEHVRKKKKKKRVEKVSSSDNNEINSPENISDNAVHTNKNKRRKEKVITYDNVELNISDNVTAPVGGKQPSDETIPNRSSTSELTEQTTSTANVPKILNLIYEMEEVKKLRDYKKISKILYDEKLEKRLLLKREVTFWNTYSYLAREMQKCILQNDWKSFTRYLILFTDAPKRYEPFVLKACIINFIYNPVSNKDLLIEFMQQCIPNFDEKEISDILTELLHVPKREESEDST